MRLRQINNLPENEVLDRLDHLYEHTPSIVELALQWRPFGNAEAFHQVLCNQVELLSDEEKLALIRAHPDLVGRAALSGSLTPSSNAEQREAGLGRDDLNDTDKTKFAEFNAAYAARFDFPFVICVRENRKRAILKGFAERLNNDRDKEIQIAIDEINKIAWYRLLDVIESS